MVDVVESFSKVNKNYSLLSTALCSQWCVISTKACVVDFFLTAPCWLLPIWLPWSKSQ